MDYGDTERMHPKTSNVPTGWQCSRCLPHTFGAAPFGSACCGKDLCAELICTPADISIDPGLWAKVRISRISVVDSRADIAAYYGNLGASEREWTKAGQ
jgi:hypothetical protein